MYKVYKGFNFANVIEIRLTVLNILNICHLVTILF